MSATVQSSDFPTIAELPELAGEPREQLAPAIDAVRLGSGEGREVPLGEQPTPVLLGHIARLEASMGAALSLLRRCMVEREAPTREALAAEAGFALGIPREAALAELDELAQLVGVSSLR